MNLPQGRYLFKDGKPILFVKARPNTWPVFVVLFLFIVMGIAAHYV